MAEVTMPRLSDTMEEGELSKWLKNVGDPVAKGDVLAEIETDKATMDLEAFEDGVLEQQLVAEGTLVPIGQPVAIIGDGSGATAPDAGAGSAEDETADGTPAPEADAPAEAPAEQAPDEAAPAPADAPVEQAPEPEPAAEPAERAAPGAETAAPASGRLVSGGIARMSPLARKMAKDHGLDPATIQGSGPDGRIIRADVEAAIAGTRPAAAAGEPAPSRPAQAAPREGDSTRVPASRIRKVAAKRLTESQLVPHFFLTAIADVDRMLELRQQLNSDLEGTGVKVSVNDFIIKAVAVTLARHPEANASWDGDAIVEHHRVNVGMAVATDDGLLVPVIKDADRKTVAEIATQSRELADKARNGKLGLDEMSGGTFSVSNLGMFGIDEFTAMLNPPEAGILAIGAASPVPTLRDGQLIEVSRLKLTLTCDHRVMDGAIGAAFLRDIVETLERPLRIVLASVV